MIGGPDAFIYGVDIQSMLSFRSFPAVMNRMATPSEAVWLYSLEEEKKAGAITLLFSAKETLLKMSDSLNPGRISFRDFQSVGLPENGLWHFTIPDGFYGRREVDICYELLKEGVITWAIHHR